jgi:hypothetical protein
MTRFMRTAIAAMAILPLLLLAGCGDSRAPQVNPPPVSAPPSLPAPSSPPAPPARPGSLAFSTDWSAPVGIALRCGGAGLLSPFGCDLPIGANWGVLPAPGNGGVDCVDPEPNICFQTSAPGWLAYHTDSFSGMALVGAQTLDRTQPISLRAVIKVDTLDCNAGVAYVGPVIYGGGVDDGDPTGNYRAEYISCFGGDEGPKLWLYESIWAGPMPGGPFAIEVGSTHELEIDWYPGDRVDYRLDRQIVFTETANFGHAPLTLQHDPHPALWFGSSTGAIGQFDIYVGP